MLQRKGELHGFTLVGDGDLLAVVIHGTDRAIGAKHHPGSNTVLPITLTGVVFEGLLHVVDARRFNDALRLGIGSGKAYGFGLLSLARAIGG